MHNKGEFEPFKMLIGAVFALMVLTIILSAIQFFSTWRTSVSYEKFYTGLQNAVEQPNGEFLSINNVFFEKDTVFNNRGIGERIGLASDCIEISAPRFSNPSFEVAGTNAITMKSAIETDVFARCYTNTTTGTPNIACEVSCQIFFAEKPA